MINSAFKVGPTAYVGAEDDYLDEGRGHHVGLMKCKGNEEQVVEALISIWNINAHGQIFKK